MKKQKFNLPFKLIIVITVVFVTTALILGYLIRSLRNLDYFKIKEVLINENNLVDLSYLKGENIFAVDLQKESKYLSVQYPIYHKVRLYRILPNRVYVDFLRRKAIALVKLYRYLYVDEEAVLFDVSSQAEDLDLPMIVGLETKIFGPKSGTKYNLKELSSALNIIKEIKKNRLYKDYKIKIINVANLNNVSFLLVVTSPVSNSLNEKAPSGLEVKVSPDNFKNKVDLLADLLTQARHETAKIKYIDLRFKEPVIKFK